MFKAIFITLLLVISANSSVLKQKIENLIGQNEYQTHKNLINILFKKESSYINGLDILYVPVIKKLQDNGLLKLGFVKPENIILEFRASYDAIKTLKIFRDTLKSLGYYYYFIKKASYTDEGQLIWTIQLKTEAAINPLIMSKELLKNSCKVIDISREENNKWIYTVDTKNGSIFEAKKVLTNQIMILKKPLRPYFLEVEENAKSINIKSRILNTHPLFIDFISASIKHRNDK